MPIVLLAALLRLGWLELTPFSYDQARITTLTLDWLRGGPLPLTGMTSSVGLSNPPLSLYLLALPLSLSPSPRAAALFINLLNVLAVVACYGLGRRWQGRAAAWVSALLFAVAPWAVLFSRNLWANSLLPPFVLLSVAAGYLALVEGRQRWLWLLPVAVALTAQLHWSGFSLVLWAAGALLLFRRRVRLRPLLGGALLGLLTWTPYLIYQAGHWVAESAQFASRAEASRVDADVFWKVWLITSGSDIHSLAGLPFRAFLASLPPYEPLFAVAGALTTASVGWLLLRVVRGPRGREREVALLLLLWMVAAIFPYLRHSVPVHIHYLIVLFPATFLAVGLFVGWAAATYRRLGYALSALVVLIAVTQTAVFSSLLNFVGARHTPGGQQPSLGYWEQAAARVRAAPVCEVKIISDGAWPIWQSEPAIFNALLHDDPRVLYFDAKEEREPPPYEDGRTLVVLAPPPDQAASYVRALLSASTDMAPVALRSGEGEIRFLYEDGGRASARPAALEPVGFANGMQLLGYAVSGDAAPGQTIRLFLHWQLIAPPGNELYVYNHLLDGSGQKWGQADGIICPMNQWHDGQQVWTWYDVTIAPDAPPGPYQLRTGLYSVPDIVNVDVLDAAGQPAGNGVRLGIP